MGRTFRNEKQWGRRSSLKKNKKQRVVKNAPRKKDQKEDDPFFDSLELEAYEDEYEERRKNRDSNKF
jgi:hypothetical protein